MTLVLKIKKTVLRMIKIVKKVPNLYFILVDNVFFLSIKQLQIASRLPNFSS